MLDTYHIARKFDGELRLGSHYIHPRCSTEVSNEHVVPVSHPLICPLCFHRPHSVLVICCGLLAKWLRVRVRVRVRIRAGARKCTRCPFFFLWSYKCGEHYCFHWFSSLRKYATSYLWYQIT